MTDSDSYNITQGIYTKHTEIPINHSNLTASNSYSVQEVITHVYCLVLTFAKTLNLMDVKSGPVRKTLNIMDANLSGFTVITVTHNT